MPSHINKLVSDLNGISATPNNLTLKDVHSSLKQLKVILSDYNMLSCDDIQTFTVPLLEPMATNDISLLNEIIGFLNTPSTTKEIKNMVSRLPKRVNCVIKAYNDKYPDNKINPLNSDILNCADYSQSARKRTVVIAAGGGALISLGMCICIWAVIYIFTKRKNSS